MKSKFNEDNLKWFFFQILKEFELIREVTEEDIEGYVEKTRMLLTNLFENSDAMTEVNIQKYIWI